MDITKQLRITLGPAIDAARAALRDLNAEDIPARLRPVSRCGDGMLPVPLVKTLLRGIEEDEWFRSKVVEAFERSGKDDPTSAVYLSGDPEWWIAVTDAVVDGVVAGQERRLARVQTDLDTTKAKFQAERAKTKALKKEVSRAKSTAKSTIETRLEPMKAAAAEARADVARVEAHASHLEAVLERVRRDRAEAESSAEALTDELRTARRIVAELRKDAASGESESVPRDPAEVARWLDRSVAALNPYRDAVGAMSGGDRAETGERWIVPAGVAPDSSEAIDALAGLDGVVVLIDGHNLLGVLDTSTMATGRARRDLVTSLGRLERHLGDAQVDVIFDSHLRDGRPVSVAPSGITVRFAEEGVIADDVIVELAAKHRMSAIVISDDREVRERCGVHGAAVLWSKALAEWLEPPSAEY
ncbi:MAG: NYN domain-containing protein [Actinomycetota bacterium]